MAFINENISKGDIEKFSIKEIDQRVGLSRRINARDWTVDSGREMYLRCVAMGREESMRESSWTFLWHGELIWVEIELLAASSGRNVPGWSKKLITKLCLMDEGAELPPRLQERRDEILRDLKEALLAYKDGGIYSSTTTYDLELIVAEGA